VERLKNHFRDTKEKRSKFLEIKVAELKSFVSLQSGKTGSAGVD
jgi:hypothetical protein